MISSSLVGETVTHGLLPQNHPKTLNQDIEKPAPIINFSAQNSVLPSQNMPDNRTHTMDLLSDVGNILSSNVPSQTLDNRILLSDTRMLDPAPGCHLAQPRILQAISMPESSFQPQLSRRKLKRVS